jgi:uncharacterized protein with HEPN domain
MQSEIAKLLWDMDDAAAKIQRYATGRTFDDYTKDDYFRSAVERQFATLGEALTRLHKVAPEVAQVITDHRKIRSFRNILVHSYDAIDDQTTWDILVNKLPTLRTDLAKLMAEATDS